MNEKKIQLGDEIIHKITGTKGIATAKTSYISGCDRIAITQKIKKDGTLPDSLTFDEPELEVVKKKKAKRNRNDIGGWKPEAKHYLK